MLKFGKTLYLMV
nr:unnamed protein product [Callosobruchus analis]